MGQQKTQWSQKKTVAPLPTTAKTDTKYPSPYGSHTCMIDEEATTQLNNEKLVVLKDDDGWYVTERNRLDQNIADANRYGSKTARDMRHWGIERVQPVATNAENG